MVYQAPYPSGGQIGAACGVASKTIGGGCLFFVALCPALAGAAVVVLADFETVGTAVWGVVGDWGRFLIGFLFVLGHELIKMRCKLVH